MIFDPFTDILFPRARGCFLGLYGLVPDEATGNYFKEVDRKTGITGLESGNCFLFQQIQDNGQKVFCHTFCSFLRKMNPVHKECTFVWHNDALSTPPVFSFNDTCLKIFLPADNSKSLPQINRGCKYHIAQRSCRMFPYLFCLKCCCFSPLDLGLGRNRIGNNMVCLVPRFKSLVP
jgi:hypothetical protein